MVSRYQKRISGPLLDRLATEFLAVGRQVSDPCELITAEHIRMAVCIEREGVNVSTNSETEKREIVQALDSVKFDTGQFSDWLVNHWSVSGRRVHRGLVVCKCGHGNLTYFPEEVGGVSKVIASVYTPFEADDARWLSEPRPDRWGDTYRMILMPHRSDCPPWPGAEVLVSGGRSISGTTLSLAEREQIAAYVQEWASMSIEEIGSTVIAVVGGYWDSLTPDVLVDDLSVDIDTLMWELGDVFAIKINTDIGGNWETVADVLAFLELRRGEWGIRPVEGYVRLLIAQVAECPGDAVTLDQHLADDLSIDWLDLVFDMEDAFGEIVEDTEAEKWERVSDVVAYVEQRLAE